MVALSHLSRHLDFLWNFQGFPFKDATVWSEVAIIWLRGEASHREISQALKGWSFPSCLTPPKVRESLKGDIRNIPKKYPLRKVYIIWGWLLGDMNPKATSIFFPIPKNPFVCCKERLTPIHSYSFRMGLEPSILRGGKPGFLGYVTQH